MDANLQAALDDAVAQDGVDNVVAVDKNGLLLGSRGTVGQATGGWARAIMHNAQKLFDEGDENEKPVVSVSTDKKTIIITEHGDVTTVVIKQ